MPRLRIAFVHSYYSSAVPSGENIVVEQQVVALREAGHEVEVFALHTDALRAGRGRGYEVRTAVQVACGTGPAPDFGAFQPDVVHVHNLFPNFGKRWLRDLAQPLIVTVHNYRPLCAAGTFYREGAVCLVCATAGSALPAVVHGCYKNRLATIPVALGQRFAREPQLAHAARVLVLSEQMRDFYLRFGVEAGKVRVLPHFSPTVEVAVGGAAADGGGAAVRGAAGRWIYVGRLSEEKGILELLRAWPAGEPLDVVGAGPLESAARAAAAGADVTCLGSVPHERVLELMGAARGLVFPSRCFEGLPLTYLEALSVGTPVVAWRPSVVSDLVTREGTGLVAADATLAADLRTAAAVFPGLRAHCRQVHAERYSIPAWLTAIESTYREAIQEHRR